MAIKASTLGGGSSGSASNDFTINVGSSGYTLVPLDTSFPIGSYICTSSLSDSTIDIYLLNDDGTSAGYANATTATTTIAATKAFNKVVIYGATNNDTLTFQFKYVFAPTQASSTNFLGAPPKIVSVSDSDLQNIDDTTTITGFNFAEDVEVAFTGTGYSSTAAKNIVRASATSLVVTRPDNFPTTAAPYTITVTNPGIPSPTSTSSHILASSLTAGNAPVWVTSATLPSFVKTVAYSQAIQATDSDGGSSVTYSIISGSLPSGISFNTSTATFSGTPTENTGTPYTYVIRATDSGGNFVNRTFSLSQAVADAPTSAAGTDVGTSRAFNNGAVSVAFTAPSYTGTSSITSYTVTASTGQTASGASSPIIVTGIATGATPTFTVTATNTGGTSLSSSASSSVTVTTVPAAPTIGSVSSPSAGSNSLSVPFTANSTGGKTITSYQILTNPGSLTFSNSSSPVSVSSLLFGTNYTFQVRALNANGYSDYSSSSGQISVAYPTTLTDNFNRSGNLSFASDGANSWSNTRGTWTANGSVAVNSDTPSNNNIASVTLAGNTISNLQADLPTNNGGMGVSFWTTNSGSWWATYVDYYTDTVNECVNYAYNFSSTLPAGCCASQASGTVMDLICGGDNWGAHWAPNCNPPNVQDSGCYSGGYFTNCRAYSQCQVTSSATRYNSRLNIANQSGVQSQSVFTQNTSSFNRPQSIAVSTSGNTITSIAYASTGKGGGSIGTVTNTPSSPTKGSMLGTFRTGSSSEQGSTIDNISASVS
jgi:hypothetical protein